jgi:hypothetical protein
MGTVLGLREDERDDDGPPCEEVEEAELEVAECWQRPLKQAGRLRSWLAVAREQGGAHARRMPE